MSGAIEIRGLRKKRGKFLLNDISLDIPYGSVVGILGENGAGKSTLLRSVLGILRKDAGEIKVLGCSDLRSHPEVRSRIGFVLDPIGIPDVFNVKDLNAIYKDTYPAWSEETFFSILTKLEADRNQPIGKMSHGSAQKTAIACALAHDADLLILDEPSGGLDPSARAQVIDLLYEATREEGKTAVLSSHITSDLEKIADRIVILKDGEILLDEAKDDLLEAWRYVSTSADILEGIAAQDVAAKRITPYSGEAVLRKEAVTADMQVRPASLEEVFTALVKGVI